MKAHRIALVLAVLVLSSGVQTAARILNIGGVASASTASRFASDGFLIERALVSNQMLYDALPAVRQNKTYLSHSDDVKALLVLFDNMHSDESCRILANLGGYYFGEDAGELYECVVLRKGNEMIPFLRHEIASSECSEKFADSHPELCLNSKDRRMYLGRVLNELARGEECSDADPSIEHARSKSLP